MEQEKKKITEEYFDTTAGDYDNSHDGRFVRCMYGEIVSRAEKVRAETILDLGCGNGNVIGLLSKKIKASFYGLDLSGNMIKEAEKRLGNQATFCVGDAENLPYEENKFDLVICNASFHHYPGPEKALDEIGRVLKPGGTLILGDPSFRFKMLVNILNFFMKYSKSGDAKIWHRRELTALLENKGFCVEQWKYINHESFILNAVRL